MAEKYQLTTPETWKPLNPPIRNGPGARNRAAYLGVVSQFDVAMNPRYKSNKLGNGETYCNIFVWDVTSAMQCEIPHWYNPSTDAPAVVGQGSEMNANGMCMYLERQAEGATKAKSLGYTGPDFCWHKCVAAEATKRANDGFPTVVGWLNKGGIGHIAMVIPSTIWEPAIAQAGLKNYYNVHVSRGFATHGPLQYYWHD